MSISSWAIAETTEIAWRDLLCALSARDVPFRVFRRRARPSPLPGRPNLEPELFPAHIWVHEAALLDGPMRLRLSEVGRILVHEKGRPLCLPQEVVDHLDQYCSATKAQQVPPFLEMLDLLDGRERLWFVLQTWGSWPRQPPARTMARREHATHPIDGLS